MHKHRYIIMTTHKRTKRTQAFTLIELLVVIAIIALLLSILFPALHKAKALAVRTKCQSRLHQGVLAAVMYAGDNDGYLPEGSVIDKSAPGYNKSWDSADLMTLMNFQTMVTFSEYNLTEQHATCETARKFFEANDKWLSPLPPTHAFVETAFVGWIYWGNRGDWTDPDTGRPYITPKRLTDTPTSRTLATCFCYNRYDAVGPSGNWPAWYAPHVKGRFEWSIGTPMHPGPDGLATAYLDASARFVKWNNLTPTNHQGQYLIYYDRDS